MISSIYNSSNSQQPQQPQQPCPQPQPKPSSCPSTFTFPTCFSLNIPYPDFSTISQILQLEYQSSKTKAKMYMARLPSRSNCRYVRITCSECEARVMFTKREEAEVGVGMGGFWVTRAETRHRHGREENLERMGRGKEERRILREKAKTAASLKRENVKKQSSSKLKHNKKKCKVNQWAALKQMLQHKKCQYLFDSLNYDMSLQKCPGLLLLTTQSMKTNYKTYGDLLNFDVIYNFIKDSTTNYIRYRLALFTVKSSTLKILIVGVAIITTERKQSIEKLFEFFIQSHNGKCPKTIVTDQQIPVEQALRSLNERGVINSEHILDPAAVLEDLRRDLGGKGEELVSMAESAIKTTNLEEYRRILQRLCEENDAVSRRAIQKFIRNRNKVCELEIQHVYVGLDRSNKQALKFLIFKDHNESQTTIYSCLKRTLLLQSQLSHHSSTHPDPFRQKISSTLSDPKIRPLLQSISRKVFQKFLQNYIKGLRQLTINRISFEVDTDTVLVGLVSNLTSEEFQVRNWQCGCGEFERRGVPCWHVIVAVRRGVEGVKEVGYEEMFAKRWMVAGTQGIQRKIERKRMRIRGIIEKLYSI